MKLILVAHQGLNQRETVRPNFKSLHTGRWSPADLSPVAADGEHVGKGLGGAGWPSPGVDDGDMGVAGGHAGAPLKWRMAAMSA